MQKTLWNTSASSTVNATSFQDTDCINDIEYVLLVSVFLHTFGIFNYVRKLIVKTTVVFLLQLELS